MAIFISPLFHQYKFQASNVEIYNETIRDLLSNGKEGIELEIKLTGKDSVVTVTNVTATNLTAVTVSSEKQVGRQPHHFFRTKLC